MTYENHYDEVNKIVTMVAKKYYKSAGMEFEDMTQELWVYVLTLELEDFALINTVLHRKAVDLVRRNYKHNYDRYIDEGSKGDAFVSEESEKVFLVFGDVSELDIKHSLESLYEVLPEKCKRYFVCKAYIESGLDMFRADFFKYSKDVPEDVLCQMLLGGSSDELIAKHILGIETSGKYITKSGTFRRIKEDTKYYVRKYL